MVWHIHFKDGKFAIWSTVVNDYLTEWGTEEEIRTMYINDKVEMFKKEITKDIDRFLKDAKNNNGCCWGTEKITVEERIGRMNRGEEPMVDF